MEAFLDPHARTESRKAEGEPRISEGRPARQDQKDDKTTLTSKM
jgi:hypothetical protein